MMEGHDYLEDEEPVFHFDDEEDEIAAMNTLADEDLIENLEPLTPVGSADPTAPATAAGSRRPHSTNFSSAQAWQHPDFASPPPSLSHSPSPRVTPATQYRPQQHRRPSRRSWQAQLSRQGSDQSLGQRAHRPNSIQSHHHEDLQQLDPHTLQHQQHAYGTPPDSLPSRHQDVHVTDPGTMNEVGDFVEIPAEDYEQMFNGNEADRITAQKFQSEVIRAFQQNGRVVFMVGQATAQWWLSPEMQKRRRAAGRRMLDIGGAVASGAGNVIMNSTPVGGVVRSVSSNVSAFRASPFRYTMQGLGILRKDAAVATLTAPTSTEGPKSSDGLATTTNGRSAIPEPAIVEDGPYDEFDDEDGMGMFGALDMDEDEEL
ncbi:hypothetical protein VP1G_03047 [Cytospora mali]|uniref:Uncharacterized protein n=1 Tax=Cytospora mali TaxID=578113 RepID=A0A194UVG3_CYTMA|nr:hypothetical protein VP1G_03047 [Valsa mali var. pyri (nom. inval.)]